MNTSITKLSKIALSLSIAATLFASCKKEKSAVIERLPTATTGVYVLCEGAYGAVNKSSITYYDIASDISTNDYFKKQNGIDLGSNANDLKQYGSKMYCVVTGTDPSAKDSYVEVINIATGKSIKRIAFSDATKGFMPRSIGFYKGHAYVSSFDGFISKIDTASLNLDSRLAVGGTLEGLAIVNGKLYVANSTHVLFPNANNASISVVDLTSFTKMKDISVSVNPVKLAATASGDVYAITQGGYSPPFAAPALERLNSMTNTKTQTYNYSLGGIAVNAGRGIVIAYGVYPAPSTLKLLNLNTGETAANFITDKTEINSPYAITINPLDEDVFVTDISVTEGKVVAFSSTGKKKFTFNTGLYPQSVVFHYTYK